MCALLARYRKNRKKVGNNAAFPIFIHNNGNNARHFPANSSNAIIADFFPLYMEKIHSFDEQQPLYSSRERNRKKNASLMPIKPYNYNIYTS